MGTTADIASGAVLAGTIGAPTAAGRELKIFLDDGGVCLSTGALLRPLVFPRCRSKSPAGKPFPFDFDGQESHPFSDADSDKIV